jgi:hypothetical protein
MIEGQSLAKLIDENLEKTYKDEHRNYIGSSSIGNPCARAIWYALKGYPKKPLTAKQIRTFEIGKILEGAIKEEIAPLGVGLLSGNSLSSYYDEDVKLFQGNVDGIININGRQIVLEIKTANDSSFQTFIKKGLKEWNPSYFSQVQAYMGMTKIEGAYILVLNKNTADLHDEYVMFDEIFYHWLKAKAQKISEAQEPPEKINKNPMFYICSMCRYKETCHA